MYRDEDTGEMVRSRRYDTEAAKLQDAAEAKRQEFYSRFGYFYRKDDGHLHMTAAEWRRNHGQLPLSLASRYDIIIDDDSSMNPRTPQNPVLPGRAAPRASTTHPAAAPPATNEDPTIRAYADQFFHGDYAKAKQKANADRAKKGLPPLP